MKAVARHPRPAGRIRLWPIFRLIVAAVMPAVFSLLIVVDSQARMVGDDALGFVPYRSESPLQQLRFGIQHRPPILLGKHETALYFEETWKNMWMHEANTYLMDAEIHTLSFGIYRGLGEGIEVSAELPVRYISGGFLDGLIEGFHKAFGLGDEGRDLYPRNHNVFAINLTGTDNGWISTGESQRGWNLGNLVVGLSFRLGAFKRLGLDAIGTLNVKLPTGTRTEFFGGQAADYGMALSVGKQFGRFHLYGCAGLVVYGQGSMIGIELNRWHRSGLLAVEYHPHNSRHSAVFEVLAENGVAREFSQFRHGTYEVVMGYKWLASKQTLFEFGLLENMFFHDNSPDFGVHIGIIRLLNHRQ